MKIGKKIYKGTTVLEALCGVPGGVDFATKRRGGAAKLKLSVLQSCSLNETSFNGVSYHVQNKGSESTIPLLCLFFQWKMCDGHLFEKCDSLISFELLAIELDFISI